MATMDRVTIRMAALLLGAGLLAGCGTTTLDRQPSEDQKTIELAAIKTERRVGDLSIDRAAEAAERFLAERRFSYGDQLIIEGGERFERARFAEALAAPGRSVSVAAGMDDGKGLRMTLIRTVATPPACADWSDPPTHDYSNLPPANWGCANQSNLARMVADPNDLAGGRGTAPLSTEKLTVLIDAYRRDAIVITEYKVTSSTGAGAQ